MSGIALPTYGHDEAESAFLAARESARLHHAWLIEGPSGIGKSRVARRLASIVLGAELAGAANADIAASDRVIQTILADGHPDFRYVWRRPDEKGKQKQDIPVSDIRALEAFFNKKSALGGWRVGVIDSIDELNRNGANALLKTLEEPPPRCVLFLISHARQPVLPTIRSRCRTLRLTRLDDAAFNAATDNAKLERVASEYADSRPGLAEALASPASTKAIRAAETLIRRPGDALDIANFITDAGADEDALQAAIICLLSRLEASSAEAPEHASAWLQLSSAYSESRELNMDSRQTAAKLASVLKQAMG